jgi:ribosomal protein S15P/S13E
MNEEQLLTHIQEVNRGLVVLTQCPMTNRPHDLQKELPSIKDAEAMILELQQQLTLTQQRLGEAEGRTPECGHGDLEEKIRDLERQLAARAPEQADWAEDREDAQAQLVIMRESANKYRVQVTRILRLTEGMAGSSGHPEEREDKGSKIAHFSGEDRKELSGWKVQLALKIAGKPMMFDTEQIKPRYALGRLEKVALAQIMPYCDDVSGEVNLDSLITVVDMLELAFGDHDKAATAKRELQRLKQRDRKFSWYLAEFQRYVADVKWNVEAQMDAL